MSKSRIRQVLSTLKAREEKALGMFLTCGFPNPQATISILRALDYGGADFLELGMPFSDPLAEGLPIQRSSEQALNHGTTLVDVLHSCKVFKSQSDTPLVLMGYANPIHHYGVAAFCRDAVASGADGLILADISLEGADLIHDAAAEAGLDLIYLVSPNTASKRAREIDHAASGFVYAVSSSGLTGDGLGELAAINSYLSRIRKVVKKNPLLVGFGIDQHSLGIALSEHTDGYIVGSALIRLVDRLWKDENLSETARLDAVTRFARTLKHGEPGS